jgi:hypothetical protein
LLSALWGTAVVLALLTLAVSFVQSFTAYPLTTTDITTRAFLVLSVVSVLAALVSVPVSMMRARPPDGLYTGTLARSLTPIFAAVVILTTGAANPYLSRVEAQCLQNDPILGRDKPGIGFTMVEARLVNRLKQETRAVVRELESLQEAGRTTPQNVDVTE